MRTIAQRYGAGARRELGLLRLVRQHCVFLGPWGRGSGGLSAAEPLHSMLPLVDLHQ